MFLIAVRSDWCRFFCRSTRKCKGKGLIFFYTYELFRFTPLTIRLGQMSGPVSASDIPVSPGGGGGGGG